MNTMNIDVKKLNRFAWTNDYSFDWNGYTIKPLDGSYDNGYVIERRLAACAKQPENGS